MHVWWCESGVEAAQQPKAPNKSTRLQCCWVNGAHLNLNGAMGPASTWLSWAAVLGSWPQSKVGAEGQLQSKRRVQPVWPSTPGPLVGLALQGVVGCCCLASCASWHQQWVLLGAAACPVPIRCVLALQQ